MNKDQKEAVVEELAGELKDSGAVLAIDYRGISVPQAAELRSALREADTRFRVVKNRLTLRAADAAGTEPLKEHLEGPTALALVRGDVALAAKTISRLGSDWELLGYKGGLIEGAALDADSFQAMARLPGLEVLQGQFAGVVASPLTGLIRGLGSMIQGLAIQLEQVRERGLVEGEPAGEAPAEEEEAAGEEAGEAEPDNGAEGEEAETEGEKPEEAEPEAGEKTEETEPEASAEGEDKEDE
jgi:large subunit ribosomal protein L10